MEFENYVGDGKKVMARLTCALCPEITKKRTELLYMPNMYT